MNKCKIVEKQYTEQSESKIFMEKLDRSQKMLNFWPQNPGSMHWDHQPIRILQGTLANQNHMCRGACTSTCRGTCKSTCNDAHRSMCRGMCKYKWMGIHIKASKSILFGFSYCGEVRYCSEFK